MWSKLSDALREIHTKNASKLSFETLYRTAYKLVLKKKGEGLYLKVKEFEERWLVDEVRPRMLSAISPNLFLGGEAFGSTDHEKKAAGEKIMRNLKQAWEEHNICMNMTTDILMYMVRYGLNPH